MLATKSKLRSCSWESYFFCQGCQLLKQRNHHFVIFAIFGGTRDLLTVCHRTQRSGYPGQDGGLCGIRQQQQLRRSPKKHHSATARQQSRTRIHGLPSTTKNMTSIDLSPIQRAMIEIMLSLHTPENVTLAFCFGWNLHGPPDLDLIAGAIPEVVQQAAFQAVCVKHTAAKTNLGPTPTVQIKKTARCPSLGRHCMKNILSCEDDCSPMSRLNLGKYRLPEDPSTNAKVSLFHVARADSLSREQNHRDQYGAKRKARPLRGSLASVDGSGRLSWGFPSDLKFIEIIFCFVGPPKDYTEMMDKTIKRVQKMWSGLRRTVSNKRYTVELFVSKVAGAHLRLHFWLTCTYRFLSHLYLQNLKFWLSYTYKGGVGWGW